MVSCDCGGAPAQATRRGIWVSNIKSSGTGNAVSCAEHIIHLTLSLLRNTRGMQQSISDRLIGTPLGQTLFGKRVLVVGLGNITAELLPRHAQRTTCCPDVAAAHALAPVLLQWASDGAHLMIAQIMSTSFFCLLSELGHAQTGAIVTAYALLKSWMRRTQRWWGPCRLAPFGAHVVVVRSREPGRGGLAPLPPDVEPLVAGTPHLSSPSSLTPWGVLSGRLDVLRHQFVQSQRLGQHGWLLLPCIDLHACPSTYQNPI